MRARYVTKEELANTPSRKDDVSETDETRYRLGTCSFMLEVGMTLKMPQLTIATAIAYFHRFYARRSFRQFDRWIIGVTCLFLAGKVEETSKRLRDVVNVFHKVKNKHDNRPAPPLSEELAFNIKDQILIAEQELLRTIAFDLEVLHPYTFVREFARVLCPRNKLLHKIAHNFVNDSLRTRVCIEFAPKAIALAAIYLGARYLKIQLPTAGPSVAGQPPKKNWWEQLDEKAEVNDIHDIANQILDLYDSYGPSDASKIISSNDTASGFQNLVDPPS